MKIPPHVRAELKKPLGELQENFRKIKALSRNHRIIAVGDVCTLGLLAAGIRPHLAVYDHQFMRQRLDSGMVNILAVHFRNPKKYSNPAGSLSEKIVQDAPKLIESGGAVLIKGEEDLTALAFIMAGGQRDIVIYGQPHRGLVLVRPEARIKKKIGKWLASAVALGHKIKRDK